MCEQPMNVEKHRDILYNKAMTGLEKIVWWAEYVTLDKWMNFSTPYNLKKS